MTAPNPKDLARVIFDPTEGTKSNLGRQVLCIDFHQADTSLELLLQDTNGQLMKVQTLQPFWANTGSSGGRVIVEAGTVVIVPRSFLARIDPPAGTEELYRAEPKRDPLQQALEELSALIDEVFEGTKNAPSR